MNSVKLSDTLGGSFEIRKALLRENLQRIDENSLPDIRIWELARTLIAAGFPCPRQHGTFDFGEGTEAQYETTIPVLYLDEKDNIPGVPIAESLQGENSLLVLQKLIEEHYRDVGVFGLSNVASQFQLVATPTNDQKVTLANAMVLKKKTCTLFERVQCLIAFHLFEIWLRGYCNKHIPGVYIDEKRDKQTHFYLKRLYERKIISNKVAEAYRFLASLNSTAALVELEDLNWETVVKRSSHYDPLLNATSIAAYQSQPDFNAAEWHQTATAMDRSHTIMAARVFPHVTAGELVVDIGCGTGLSSKPLLTTGVRIVGCDFSIPMLQTFLRDEAKNILGVQIFLSDSTTLPLQNGCADHVISNGVLYYLRDLRTTMMECARILRPGGKFHFSTTHPEGKSHEKVLMDGTIINAEELAASKTLAFFHPWGKIEQLLQDLGLTVLETDIREAHTEKGRNNPVVYRYVTAQKT